MKISDIQKLSITMGIKADFRKEEVIKDILDRKRKKYDKLSGRRKLISIQKNWKIRIWILQFIIFLKTRTS